MSDKTKGGAQANTIRKKILKKTWLKCKNENSIGAHEFGKAFFLFVSMAVRIKFQICEALTASHTITQVTMTTNERMNNTNTGHNKDDEKVYKN